MIHREVYAVVPPKVEYSLTHFGRSLEPMLVLMRDWGAQHIERINHAARGESAGT